MTLWTDTRHGAVAVLTFTNPPRNLMPMAGMTELREHLDRIATDDSVTVVVLIGGIDGYFVAHADTADLAKLGHGEPVDGDPADWSRALALMAEMPQPVVAAVDGQAWGGGCEISLGATMRVASTAAHFAQPEVAVGIIPGAGGTQRLSRLVGTGRAARMVLTGEPIDADDALRIGLVEAVLPDDGFLDHVLTWVAPMIRHPRGAVVAAKRAVLEGSEKPLAEGLALETQMFIELQMTEEAVRLEGEVSAAYQRGEDWSLD
ncbi:MAG TPA: enoyl-CoA hydratase/isomerase family protein [Acidimicrobiales bacterium]